MNKAQINEINGYKNIELIGQFKNKMRNIVDDNQSDTRIESIKNFIEYLEDHGYEVLGSGSYGLVFTHPKLSYGIKIFKRDPAYLHFVKLVLRNQNNIHFPKFFGRFMRVDGDHYAVRTEILKPVDDSLETLYLAMAISTFCNSQYKTWDQFRKENDQVTPTRPRPPLSQKIYLRRIEIFEKAVTPDLLDAIQIVRSNKNGFDLDLHSGNLMMRGNTIVFVDPYCA